MKRLLGLAAYAAFVVANFLYVYFCPPALAPAFLTTYPLVGFIGGLALTVFYTSHRSRLADNVSVLIFGLVGVAYLLRIVSPSVAFGVLALGMIMADYSVAQTRNSTAQTCIRLISALSALALFWNFEIAVGIRLLLTAAFCFYGTLAKPYAPVEPGEAGIGSKRFKWLYAVASGILYFGPLALIVHFINPGYKEAYIAYAASGNVVLKMLDYDIKQIIARAPPLPPLIYTGICVASVLMLVAASVLISYKIAVLVAPLLALGLLRGIVSRANWN